VQPVPRDGRPRNLAWIFPAALLGFYSLWAFLVFVRGYWPLAVAHWPIAVAMAAGSYFAGSTPMGGGTVGFPVLVLLFHGPASLGRDFSFAVQAAGMTSAGIFIVSQRRAVVWPMLRWAFVGSLIGTPLGLIFLAPVVPGLIVKILFAVIWASFAVMTLVKLREVAELDVMTPLPLDFHRRCGLLIGVLGGAFAAALTGVGIDMIMYAVLVLLCRADLKVAVPTAVILMAFTSLVGIATRNLQGTLNPETFGNWLAAAPIVVLGAPFGAFIMNRIGRTPTLIVVAILCLAQFVWTCSQEWRNLGVAGLAAAIGGVLLFNLCFDRLYRAGLRLRAHASAEALGESADAQVA
jgi:uncharacterized membrane protein YfcA